MQLSAAVLGRRVFPSYFACLWCGLLLVVRLALGTTLLHTSAWRWNLLWCRPQEAVLACFGPQVGPAAEHGVVWPGTAATSPTDGWFV